MKKNLPNASKSFVAIATSISKVVAIAIICFAFANANATNINATFTAPTKFGGCIDSVFTLTYLSPGNHSIKITANLDSGAENNCSSSSTYRIFIDSVSVSTGVTVNYIDNAHASFKCSVTVASSITIKWHVRVDCSILSYTNFLQSVNLIQHFKDTANNYNFKINGGSDSSLTNVIVPRIFNNQSSTPTFYTSYLTQRIFEYTFLNFTDADFKMKFKFHVNDTTICGKATTDSFAYSTSAYGTFTKFTMDNLTLVSLPKDSDLFIRQYVTGLQCLDSICSDTATFQWQCAFGDTVESYFCSSCGKTDTIKFEVEPKESPIINIENLTANNSKNDFSCFNTKQSWSYRFTQSSVSTSASDSMFAYIQHYGGGNGITNLTLIPSDSIQVDCKHCTATVKITNAPYSQHLCHNYVDSSLTQLEVKVYDFEFGDTLLIHFKTFRCAEENDTELLNKPKNLNNWIALANSYSVCGKLFGSQVYLSSENFEGYGSNIDQQIQFFPKFNNIVVPQGQSISDTNYLSLIMDGLDKRFDYYSNQHFGYSRDSLEYPCRAKGILRARVTLDEGLHVYPDSIVYFQLDTGGLPLRIYPDYYYHTSTSCQADTFYFYFHLSDTMYYILYNGTFETNVEACCPNDNAPNKYYTMDFHVMPFPDSTCISNSNFYPPDTTHTQPPTYSTLSAFIPMSGKRHTLHIRCPGCLQPGSIVEQYKLKRISFGLQDSNNNGFADYPQTAIHPDSGYFASHINDITELNSSYGSRLAEFTVAHFEDGDSTNNGYAYAQMRATGAILNYIQYSVSLEMLNDSLQPIADTLANQQLGLTPDSLWFFIDLRNTGSPYCLDCKPFETDTFFRTVLKISVGASDLNKFLIVDTANANWFYTFSFVPTDSGSVVGISNPFNKYYDATLFHDSLHEWQRYRIAVFYKECKHFNAPLNTQSLTVEDVMKRREINTLMWFAGDNHGSNTFSNIPTAPQNYSELNLHGWKAYSDNDTLLTNMNQQFADSFIFFCEMNGGLHYFFAEDLTFTGYYSRDVYSCGLNMTATAVSRTAAGIYDPFPYEYLPPSLYLNQLAFQKPANFNGTVGRATNFIYVPYPNGYYISAPVHFNLPSPDSNNFIVLNTQSISPPYCLDESHYQNFPPNDSSAYIKDGYNANTWVVNFQPDNCFANFVVDADTAIYALYGNINLSCITSSGCVTGDSVKGYDGEYNITSKANLQTTIQPSSNGAISNEMCWHVELTNPDTKIDSLFITPDMHYFYTAAAAHIYFVPPAVSFLNNWTFTPDLPLNYTINIPNGTIFHWANSLPVGSSLSGTFCAEYFPCVGEQDTNITFILGYDCNNFPAVPFEIDTNCITYLMRDKPMHDVTTNPPLPSSNPVTFSICHQAKKVVDYTTQTTPYIYPDSVVLYNMPSQIIIDSAFFSLCSDTSQLHKLSNSVLQNHWLINRDTLDSAGYFDGALTDLNNYDCIRIHLFLHQECDFINGVTNDSLVLFSHNHCDTVYPSAFSTTTFIWDSTSHCTDCFTLTKTVDQSTAYAGDTITYSIIVCANNDNAYTVTLKDLLPPHFVAIINPLDPDTTQTIVAQGCDTFQIIGYFNQIDTCPFTADTAILVTADTMLTYSVCNTIVCDTCFTITKTVDRDTAVIGDTITYYITVHSYNNTPKDIFISDILPPNFHPVSNPFPLYVANFPAGTSVTYTVTGYFTQPDSCPNTMNTVNMIDISSNTYSDSICIVVTYPCISESSIIITDTSATTFFSSSTITDSDYLLVDTLYIDMDMTFTNCIIHAMTGSQIIVQPGFQLILDNTIIEGCNFMWQGITVDSMARINMTRSTVRDANVGLNMIDWSYFVIEDSYIIDCITGLLVPEVSCQLESHVDGEVTGTLFGLTRSTLLKDYSGQPTHGKLPKVGIEVNDYIRSIGNDLKNKNRFVKLNNGITTFRSSTRLYNSTFESIAVDTAYHRNYDGTAIVSRGRDTINCGKTGLIYIYPVHADDTLVYNCYRGVFTNFSELWTTQNKIIKVHTGIFSSNCKSRLSSRVTNCMIHASHRGINWRNNAGSTIMIADTNLISITDRTGIGINMNEMDTTGIPNYNINGNTINLYGARHGINANSVYNPFIAANNVNQYSVSSTYPTTNGVSITGCKKAVVTCNIVITNYPDTIPGSTGLFTSMSSSSTITCNTALKQHRGVFFGGNCWTTEFKGNEMDSNYVGLYLNKTGVIDQQPFGGIAPYHGNIWGDTLNFSSGYGAVNMNDDNLANLVSSLITTNKFILSYNPIIPLDSSNAPFYAEDIGWFDKQTSTDIFNCSADTICGWDAPPDEPSMGLRMSIAQGNSISSEFIPESKMVAEQYLYGDLKADSILTASNIAYQDFVDSKENTSVGYLYKTSAALSMIGKMDSSLSIPYDSASSLIKIHIDSIRYLDSLSLANNINYSTQIDVLRNSLSNEYSILSNIIEQQNALESANIVQAEIMNNNASPIQLPDANEKFINGIEILYLKQGDDGIASYYYDILEIASQCPYQGGVAVYRARHFASLFNDSIEFDDEGTCLQQGIYKQAQLAKTLISNDVSIVPNPANERAEIILKGTCEGICDIELIDVLGRKVMQQSFNCKEQRHSMKLDKLSIGIYSVFVTINKELIRTTKLIIAR